MRPFSSSFARTKRSIGLRTQAASLTAGGSGRFGAMNDQCGWYSAPAATQRLSRSFCSAVSVFLDVGRGHDLLGVVREDPRDQLARRRGRRARSPRP